MKDDDSNYGVASESCLTEQKVEAPMSVVDEDEELRKLLMPDVQSLPVSPPSAVESNFDAYFAPGKCLDSLLY